MPIDSLKTGISFFETSVPVSIYSLSTSDNIQIHLRKPNYNQELSQLQQILLHTFSVLPETQIDEYYKTIAINELNKHFKSLKAIPKQISNNEWKAIRCIITVLILYSADVEPIVSIYHNIREGLIKNSDFNVKAEIRFFKKQIQYINKLMHKKVEINPLAQNICTEIFEDLNVSKTYAKPGQIQEAYLEWRHTPKVFVSYLQSAIANGYITLKGNADMKPIIEFISTFVKVKKQNNSGNLSEDSLLSYFKKASTGEL